jgi:hypothetical protein
MAFFLFPSSSGGAHFFEILGAIVHSRCCDDGCFKCIKSDLRRHSQIEKTSTVQHVNETLWRCTVKQEARTNSRWFHFSFSAQ